MSLFFIKHPGEADLALFAGGELGPLARWRIEKHLSGCDHCQEVVADFFHLQGDLSEIAELPDVDWPALAHQIKVAGAQAAPEAGQAQPSGWFLRPAAWKLGLASATALCAFVVFKQFPLVQPEPAMLVLRDVAPNEMAEQAVVSEADAESTPAAGAVDLVTLGFADKKAASEENKSFADGPARQESDDVSGWKAKESPQVAQKADRLARSNAAGPTGREAFSALGGAARADSNLKQEEAQRRSRSEITSDEEVRATSAVADARSRPAQPELSLRKMQAAETRQAQAAGELLEGERGVGNYRAMAPAPPAEPQPGRDDRVGAGVGGIAEGLESAESASATTETEPVLEARLREAGRTKAEVARRLSRVAAVKDSTSSRDEDVSAQLSFLPAGFENVGSEIGVAADGWVSIRTLDSDTSTITITNVYVP